VWCSVKRRYLLHLNLRRQYWSHSAAGHEIPCPYEIWRSQKSVLGRPYPVYSLVTLLSRSNFSDSSASTLTVCWAGWLNFKFRHEEGLFSSPLLYKNLLWHKPDLPSNTYRDLFPWGYSRRSVKLPTHLRLVPKGLDSAILYLHSPIWLRGVEFRHRDKILSYHLPLGLPVSLRLSNWNILRAFRFPPLAPHNLLGLILDTHTSINYFIYQQVT